MPDLGKTITATGDLSGDAATRAAPAALSRDRRGFKRLTPFLGPAFVASVAYIDPGNFATNVQAGSSFGYMLLWVVLAANLMAILIQSMSAKLGIATGQNLAEVARDRFPKPFTVALWIQAELIAMATDVAEIIGGALGLHLLFGIALFPAGLLVGVFSFALLELRRRGFRPLEAAIVALIGLVVASLAYEVWIAKPNGRDLFTGLFVPTLDGTHSLLLAVGILGATVMPHVIYLHSALTQHRVQGRTEAERRTIFRFEFMDVLLAMGIAGVVNGAMLVMAAGLFYGHGAPISTLEGAYSRLHEQAGTIAAVLFGVGLLASGLASSSVGTLSGEVVMQGFIHRKIPLWLRRLVTMVPSLFLLALGVNATNALVISQVVLSFGIPFALIPLLLFCSNRPLMGTLVNHWLTTWAAWVVTLAIVLLNMLLLYQALIGV
ncbi:MAG: Nramp family divalent metal transporter [Rhodanobacter sp.]